MLRSLESFIVWMVTEPEAFTVRALLLAAFLILLGVLLLIIALMDDEALQALTFGVLGWVCGLVAIFGLWRSFRYDAPPKVRKAEHVPLPPNRTLAEWFDNTDDKGELRGGEK